MAVKKKIRKGVTPPLVKHPLGQAIINLTGTQYGTFPVWTPKSAQWELRVEATTNSVGSVRPLLGDFETADERLVILTDGKLSFGFGDATNTPRYVATTGSVSVGKRFTVTVRGYADKVTIALNGVVGETAAYAPNIADIQLFYLATRFGTSSFWDGTIHRCEFIDLSPLQSVRAMAGTVGGVHARFPAIPVSAGSKLSLWVRPDTLGVNHPLVLMDSAWPIHISSTNLINLDASYGSNLKVNGVATTSGTVSVTAGTHYFLEATLPVAGSITRILSNAGGTTFAPSTVMYVRIEDAATGKVWEYNNANDTGNLLVNSSNVDRLGPELAGRNTPYTANPIAWTNHGDGSYTLDTDGSVPYPLEFFSPSAQIGSLYTVTFTIDWIEYGALAVQNDGSPNYAAPGTYTHVQYVADLNGAFAFKRFSGPTKLKISNISFRRIYALKTAEGAELWNDAAAVYPIGWARNGSTFTRTAIAGESVGTGVEIPGVIVTDKFYRLRFRHVSRSGAHYTVFVGQGTQAVYQTSVSNPAPGAWVDVVFKSTSVGTQKLLFQGFPGCNTVVSDISVKEVTHGLWYQSGAVMTDAAANAARTLLAPINRSYDFADSIPTLPAASPLQLARVMNSAAVRAPKIPSIPLAAGSKIEVWVKHLTPAGESALLAVTGYAQPLWVSVNNLLYFNATLFDATLDDVAVADGTATLTSGNHYKITLTAKIAVTLTNLGESGLGAKQYAGHAAWRVLDATNGKLYHYANLNDTGNVLTNLSNVDRLGPELWDLGDVVCNGNANWNPALSKPDFFLGQEQYVHRLTFTIEGLDGGEGLNVFMKSGSGRQYTKDGTYTLDVGSAPAGQDGIAFTPSGSANNTNYWRVSNISIRRIYSLATAEGAWVDTKNPLGKGGTGWTIHGDGSYSLASSSGGDSFWFIDTAANAGKHYLLSFDVEELTGEGIAVVASGYSGNTAHFAANAVGHWEFVVSANQNPLFKRSSGYVVAKIRNIKMREVTHGLWYEGSTAMTDAAANTARTMLPALPKRMAKAGDVYSRGSTVGTVINTVTPYQMDAKWTDNGGGRYTLVDPDGSATSGALSFAAATTYPGKKWEVVFYVESISEGASLSCVNAGFSGGGVLFTANAVGWWSYIADGDVNNSVLFKRGTNGVPTTVTISNISIRESSAVKWTGLTADNIIEGELA